jgi:transposase
MNTDNMDAGHILKLLMEGRFPKLWRPSPEQRDLRQLLMHRHKLVEIRTRIKNGLQHLMLNSGVQKKRKLWTEAGQQMLRQYPLQGWAACRREDLLRLLHTLNEQVGALDRAVEQAAEANAEARLLMTQPGVGPVTALAFVLTIGEVRRFQRGKQVASYLGLIPREHSSGGRQKLGSISKQGNRFLRTLLIEATQSVIQFDEGFRKQYQHRTHRMAKGVAKVAAARRLAVRLFWMLGTKTAYPEIVRIESSPQKTWSFSGHYFDRGMMTGLLIRRIDLPRKPVLAVHWYSPVGAAFDQPCTFPRVPPATFYSSRCSL